MYRFGTAAIMLAASTRRIDPPAGRYAAGFHRHEFIQR